MQSLDRNALQHEGELIAGDGETAGIQVEDGDFEGAFLQPAVKDGKTAPLPDQQFEMRTRAIDENKGIPAHRLLTKLRTHQAAERIKTPAHIGLLSAEMIPAVISQMNKTAHRASSLRYAASTGWYIFIVPTCANNTSPLVQATT